MRSLIGLVVAVLVFAFAFVLHIVGGATDQGWLFAFAVVLVFVSATALPAIAVFVAGRRNWVTGGIGTLIGVVFTSGALWAANDREMAWWTIPAALLLVVVVSGALLAVLPTDPPRIPARGDR